ncbi:DUF1671-domain-containing protein [Trametopsis cervina]|nr:DUF1671-domain-containing protein [Trametopsis cervina]
MERKYSNVDGQSLYQTSIECPSCSLDLTLMTPEKRNEHCNNHFASEPEVQGTCPVFCCSYRSHYLLILQLGLRAKDVFWRSSQTTAPPPNFTPGLIPLLKKSLTKSHSKGATQKAYLCSAAAVHIATESWDRSWGCGYLNFLMSCTALMDQGQQPSYSRLLELPSPPGVRRLQRLIEQAWEEGYDEEGAQQLNHRLLGTNKWIGTAELYVALSYRGVPSRLVDFELNKRGPELLIDWIIDYFGQGEARHNDINQALLGASPVVITDRLPLVLQHAGHSRTVVGFERRRDGTINLLMFDPSRRVPTWIRQAALSDHPSSNTPRSSKPTNKHSLSPSKLVNKVLHPHHNRRKRHASNSFLEIDRAKRVRAGDEVIVIDSDDDENEDTNTTKSNETTGEVDWSKIAEHFRVKAKTLGKKDKYQVLYFPMSEALTDAERQARKIVTSKRVA